MKNKYKTKHFCHVEGWFSIVKQHILQKARRLRPGNFVRKMYASLQGRYTEHIMQHGLSQKLLKSPRNLKDIRFAEESWAKKEEKTGSSKAGHSKFYSVPPRIPGPKKKAKSQGTTTQATLVTETDAKEKTSVSKHEEDTSAPKKKQTGKPKICDNVSTAKESGTKSKMTSIDDADLSSMTTIGNDVAATLETTPQNVQKETEELWEKRGCEVVVAVQKNAINKARMSVRHKDFNTLKPHNLLNGEIIEYYMHAYMNKCEGTKRLFIQNHFTVSVILFGKLPQIARQGLRKVNFENYDGAVGFVNVHRNHWKFVLLHAMSEQIYVADPNNVSNDLKDSKQAATRFRKYFRIRFKEHGKRDWLNIRWKPSTIVHTVQKDATSCGVFVAQMAREVIEKFPVIPDAFNIDPNSNNIVQLRQQMAKDILEGSESKEEYCSYCGCEELPKSKGLRNSKSDVVWIQCEQCQRWYHVRCLGLSPDVIAAKDAQWFCLMCD
ncbi:uncharacterized protein LOC125277911 [Megalobrama amblycephala]|uniref:uncharacterized protein LOC125277911 n=1 Tax=Megalobrama amblycephala TaxID=75352 RepID=UPI00201450D0|nr:uncharacterized protein LOC125277911 [Megalobrama amblycephala]